MTRQQEIPLEQGIQNPIIIWSPTISAVVAIVAVFSQLISIMLTYIAQRKSITIQQREVDTLKKALQAQENSLKLEKETLKNQDISLEIQRNNLEETIRAQRENLIIQRDAIKNASLLEFSKRYDYIYFELRQKVKNKQYPIEDYYTRFWSLQQDEYISWLQGFLDNNAYKMFLKARKQEYSNRDKPEEIILEGGLKYREGFHLAQEKLGGQTSKFFSFMFRIFTEERGEIDNIMRKEKEEYIERNSK